MSLVNVFLNTYFHSAASWIIPGMEDMDGTEYYAALNKRIADAKAARKAAGEVTGPRCASFTFTPTFFGEYLQK